VYSIPFMLRAFTPKLDSAQKAPGVTVPKSFVGFSELSIDFGLAGPVSNARLGSSFVFGHTLQRPILFF
jgi:hypothetical protein